MRTQGKLSKVIIKLAKLMIKCRMKEKIRNLVNVSDYEVNR